MNIVILLGAPGAGKGTAASIVCDNTPYVHISTGDVLREALKDGRSIGLQAKEYMESGELVPDDIILTLIKELLDAQPAQAKLMFDGFPRTRDQVTMLDDTLQRYNATVDHVFLLEAPEEVLVARLANRRICKSCGAVYNLITRPAKKEGICDACEGSLYQREDDYEETVRNRLEVFKIQTESLVGCYSERGLLRRIQGAESGDAAGQGIVEHLQAEASSPTN